MHSSVQSFWSTSASKAWKKKRKARSQSVKAPRWCTREKLSAALNNIWQAKTPDLPRLFCSTGFHLSNMFPLKICKARAALVPRTQHFQPWNTISIYPNSEPVSIFLFMWPLRHTAVPGRPVMKAGNRGGGFMITCWVFDVCQWPCEHDGWGEQRSCSCELWFSRKLTAAVDLRRGEGLFICKWATAED